MSEDQESPLLDFNTMLPDPDAVRGQVESQQQQQLAQAPAAYRGQMMMQIYGQRLAGGDPRVQDAVAQRQAMTSIMQQVNQDAPDNEDPLAYQERLSHAMVRGMAQANPQVAMAAAQNLVRVQEAKSQRDILLSDSSIMQSKAGEAKSQAAVQQALGGKIVFAKQGDPDGNGLPTSPAALATLDVNDPNFAQQVAKLNSDAQKGGYALMPMTPDQYMNGRGQIAIARGQFALQAAQLRAEEGLKAAMLRSQQTGAGMDGRTAQMVGRVLSGAEMAGAAVGNVANMEFGASTGILGTGFGAHGGDSVFEGARDTMRNTLTSQEQQQYTTFAQPIWRGIAAIEAQGGLQGGQQLSASIKAGLEIHPGDTPLTIMGKLAQVRQDIETGTQVQLANPKLDPKVKAQVQEAIGRLTSSIPWTVGDVQAFGKAQEKSPQLTYRQWAQQQEVGEANTTKQQPVTNQAPGTQTGASGAIDAKAERAAALEALAKGAPHDKVSERYKQRTGQDL